MKIRLFFICTLFMILMKSADSQNVQSTANTFDNRLQQLTDELSLKLSKDSALKMAVWDLSDLNENVSPIGKYIAEDISINLSDKFHITNRNQLHTLLKENQLSSEGFINQSTLKQVKKLSDIDIIITGTVSILSENIKITLQALNSNGDIVGATKGEVPMNGDVKELLGINSANENKGFNRPLNSNEQLNNPATVNNICDKNNTGDYCFYNNGIEKLDVIIFKASNSGSNVYNLGSGMASRFYLSSKESKCIYNLIAGNYTFSAMIVKDYYTTSDVLDKGDFIIEKCKSKTYTIK